MTNEVISDDPNKPVTGSAVELPIRRFNPFNESRSFFDDAAIARLKEIEEISDEGEQSVQMKLFILRQALFLPTAPMYYSFFDNVSKLIDILGLEETKKKD